MKPRIRKNPGLISFPEEKKFTRSQSELISRQSREHISPAGELISARRADDKSQLRRKPQGNFPLNPQRPLASQKPPPLETKSSFARRNIVKTGCACCEKTA